MIFKLSRFVDYTEFSAVSVYMLLIIFLMPIAGIYFLCKPDSNAKVGGAFLLIVGLILWAFIAFNS